MNAARAIHTAARRYCLQQYSLWTKRYAEIVRTRGERGADGYHYSAEELATFPRYNVLDAIRVELERLDPASLDDLNATRELLLVAGDTAESDVTRQPISDIDERAMADEREAFRRYILGLTNEDLNSVESLPYRRVLRPDESKLIWSRFRERWCISDHYWYPLAETSVADIVALKTRPFEKAVPHARLQGIMTTRGIARVWELREYGPEYKQDVALFEPCYNGSEGYWSSGALDWIIYASHESSITVGGWMVDELKTLWPSWEANVWTWTGIFD
jgi:hypothetical protein